MPDKTLRIFDYIADLDCFLVSGAYRQVADALGLSEWHPAVWIGRLFMLDNDYGEHWFDNWELRERLQPAAERLGMSYEELMVIDPERFQNGADGPCHAPEVRKSFWRDVLRSLALSYDLLFAEARRFNEERQRFMPEEYIHDLEERIAHIRASDPSEG